MTQRNKFNKRSEFSLGSVLRQVFLQRGFIGMMGITWGFMLGGALLMIWMTTTAALCGLSAFNTGIFETMFAFPLLAVYWIVANEEYQEHHVVNGRGFLRVVFISFFVSSCFPAVLLWFALVEQRERWRRETNHTDSPRRTTKEAQGVFAAVGQQMSGLWGGHSAHNF